MIKFLDIKKINAQYQQELKAAAEEVIDSGWYLPGEKVKLFESNLSKYTGTKNAIGVANGMDALRLILKAYIELGVMNENDEVIVPANTYIASILAITDNRLKPILVEPDINSYNLDITLIEKGIQTMIHYPIPPHKQRAKREWNELSLPITEKIHDEVLSLPISPVMNNKDVELAVKIVNDF